MDRIEEAKGTFETGKTEGISCCIVVPWMRSPVATHEAWAGEIIKSDRGARRKREHLEISESPTNYFSPVACCLKGQDTRHIARDGGRERKERSNGNQCRQIPPLPRERVARKSSPVHFLLSSTLFRHYSSPRAISNPDRRRLPSLFLLFMVKFIGSSALLPSGCENRRQER